MNFRPTTPLEKVLRCVTLHLKTTCEKRKKRIEMIKENIIAKENERIDKNHSLEKTKKIFLIRKEINEKYFNL